MISLLCASLSAAGFNMNVAPPEEPPATLVAWGLPLAGGTLKGLLIAPRFTLRDAEELAARLDIDLNTVALWDAAHLGDDPAVPSRQLPGFQAEEVAARIRDRLEERCDVILLARFPLGLLPEQTQSALVAKLARGTGLILIEHGETAVPSEGPLAQFLAQSSPAGAEADLLRGVMPLKLAADASGADAGRTLLCANKDDTRIAHIQYPDAAPAYHCLVPALPAGLSTGSTRLDNALSLVARVCCWAAGRTPGDRIAGLADAAPPGPDAEVIPPFLTEEYVDILRDSMMSQPLRPYRLELAAPAKRDYEVAVQVRNPGALVQFPEESEPEILPKGATSLPLYLRVGPGRYLVDIWLKGRNGVEDWFSQWVVVQGWPEIESLVPDRTFLKPQDALGLQVQIRPTLAALSQPRQATVYARALTPTGALLAEALLPTTSDGGALQFGLQFEELETPLVKVEVYALDGVFDYFSNWLLNRAPRRDLYFPVLRGPAPASFEMVAIAPGLDEFNARTYLENLRRMGFGAVHAPGGPLALFQAANLGLELVPELSRYNAPVVVDGTIRQPCLSNPEFSSREGAALRGQALVYLAGASGAYSLGNGNVLCDSDENVCQSPSCLAGLREFLRTEYPSLDALNASWKSDFSNWAGVRPPAHSQENIPAYIDFRCYMDRVFADFHRQSREQVRGVDPDGAVGFRAIEDTNPRCGYDWAALAAALDWLAVPAEPVAMAKLRSYGNQGRFSGAVLPGARSLDTPGKAAWFPWYSALHQFPAMWCAEPFGDALDAAPEAWLEPSGDPVPALRPLFDTIDRLDDGVAALLIAAERPPRTVAMYESRRSRYLNAVDNGFGVGGGDAERAWVLLLEGLGYDFDFVPEGRLDAAALAGIRVLILPAARALDTSEAEAIADFASQGGAVLADIAPATYDGHGVPRSAGALDGLFGVQRTGAEGGGPEQPVPLRMSNGDPVFQDGCVRAVLGTPESEIGELPLYIETGEAPAANTDQTGGGTDAASVIPTPAMGRTLLLNHTLPQASAQSGPWIEVIRHFLELAGASPALQLPDKSADQFTGTRFAFTYGAAQIAALLPGPSAKKERIRLEFGKNQTVYDLLAGARCSNSHHVSVTLESGQAQFFVSLPYRVKEIVIAPLPPTPDGGRLPVWLGIETQGGEPDRHLVRLQWLANDGSPLDLPPRDLVCTNGIGECELPLHFGQNQYPFWLEARDLLTGVSARSQIQIISRSE